MMLPPRRVGAAGRRRLVADPRSRYVRSHAAEAHPTTGVPSMHLVWPSERFLPSYVDALERGWAADPLRGEAAAREELAKIAQDPARFVAGLVDREATGAPITLMDGSSAPVISWRVR